MESDLWRGGVKVELVFDPQDGSDKRPPPQSLIDDMADWCSERGLFGTFVRVDYNHDGNANDGSASLRAFIEAADRLRARLAYWERINEARVDFEALDAYDAARKEVGG